MVLPKVVAVASSPDEAKEGVALGADVIEARADLAAGDPVLFAQSINKLGKPLIVTVRAEFEGGHFGGSDEERALLYKKLLPYANYVDVELRAKNVDDIVLMTRVSGAVSIVSYHVFDGTPTKDEMADIFLKCREKGDIGKLATMARSPADVLALYGAALEAPKPLCAIAMGPIGMHSRIVAPIYGSMLTYGYVRKPVAPGQMRVDKIIEGLKLLGLR